MGIPLLEVEAFISEPSAPPRPGASSSPRSPERALWCAVLRQALWDATQSIAQP
jgi:hypothetical protein